MALATSCAPASAGTPINYGVLVFPGFQALDVFGPLDALNTLSFTHRNITLSVLSRSLAPVSTLPLTLNTTFGESIVPTHTLSSPPPDLDVLVVPGGAGTRAPNMSAEVEFIKNIYPKLQYMIVVCTGNGLVARTGIFDGKRATGNKKAWAWVTAQSDKVHWVGQARWVREGNIWSTSGISAGIDGTFDFMSTVYGEKVAQGVANDMEYTRVLDWQQDEFGKLYNVTDKLPVGMNSTVLDD